MRVTLKGAIRVFEPAASSLMRHTDYGLDEGDEITIVGDPIQYCYDHSDMMFYYFEYGGEWYFAKESEIKDSLPPKLIRVK